MCQIFGKFTKWQLTVRKIVDSSPGAFTIIFLMSGAFPAISATRIMDFETALSIADSVNPEIRSGLSRIRESQERKKQIESNLLPQLSASGSYARIGEVPPGKKYLLGTSNDDFYTDITAKQLLFAGGKYRNQIYAADTLTKMEEQKLFLTRRNARLAIARAYFEAVRTRFAVNVQRDLIRRMQAQVTIAELLFDGGKISSLDVVRLRTQILTSRSQQNTLESQVKTRQYLLAQAIGVTDTVTVADSAMPGNIENVPIDLTGLEKELGQSPEMQTAQVTYQKALLDKKVAEADYLPAASINAGYNFEGGSQSGYLITDHPNWIAGVSVTMPIYRGGGIRAQVAQAQERIQQAGNVVAQTNVSLIARLRSAIESINDKKEKIGITKQILESADETIQTAELRYSTGKLGAFELIDAQTVYARSQQDLFNAQVDYRIAFEELAAICPSVLNTKGTGK